MSIAFDLALHGVLNRSVGSEFFSYRLFTIFEYSLVSLFLFKIIQNATFRKFITFASLAFLSFSIFDLISSRSKYFDSIATGISCILILVYSIFYLFEQIKSPNSLFLYSTPNFWIVVAFIVFFSGTFFIFIFSQNNYDNPEFKATFSIINSIFNIIKNLLIAIAFIIKPEKAAKKKTIPVL